MMALIVASYSLAVAQAPTTFGVGINTPVGTLHVHSAEGISQGIDPIVDPGPFPSRHTTATAPCPWHSLSATLPSIATCPACPLQSKWNRKVSTWAR